MKMNLALSCYTAAYGELHRRKFSRTEKRVNVWTHLSRSAPISPRSTRAETSCYDDICNEKRKTRLKAYSTMLWFFLRTRAKTIIACPFSVRWRRNCHKIQCIWRSRTTTRHSLPTNWKLEINSTLNESVQGNVRVLLIHLWRNPDDDTVRIDSCIATKPKQSIARMQYKSWELIRPNCRGSALPSIGTASGCK